MIATGVARSELKEQFGSPVRKEDDDAYVWETRFDELNYATLKVWFGPDNKAQNVSVTRAHGFSSPDYFESGSITWNK
jgi:hypothetical protein